MSISNSRSSLCRRRCNRCRSSSSSNKQQLQQQLLQCFSKQGQRAGVGGERGVGTGHTHVQLRLPQPLVVVWQTLFFLFGAGAERGGWAHRGSTVYIFVSGSAQAIFRSATSAKRCGQPSILLRLSRAASDAADSDSMRCV
jgi:hypothetical protein